MKKSKLITCLSAAFVSAVALMSCSSLIKSRDGVILTIDGVEYRAEDLFNDQKTPAAAEAKFNAVYKVAIRRYFMDDKPGHADMPEITRNTKIKINEQKATAQSNADKNGTSYAVEWQKILDSNGVENEQGLYDKLEYDLQKEKFENHFYEDKDSEGITNYDRLRSGEFPGYNPEQPYKDYKFKNYLQGKQPYHIKHILVKLSSAKAGDSVNTEISAQEARKLGNIIINLAKGKDKGGSTFEALASSEFNDDTTARENHGSLGIMSRDTSFVNDFKLGIYMYEAYFGSSTNTGGPLYKDKTALVALGLDNTTAEGAGKDAKEISTIHDPTSQIGTGVTYGGLGQIPYGAAKKLVDYADYDFGTSETAKTVKERFSKAGLSSNDVAAKYYPRNVIFNKYFNKHNIMVITPRNLHNYEADAQDNITDWVKDKGTTRTDQLDYYRGANMDSTSELPGFVKIGKNTDEIRSTFYDDDGNQITDDKVLRDENGRVILVFRSGTGDSSSNDAYQGIHFVVIERSPFIKEETDEGTKKTKLEEYYTHYYPTQVGGSHPTYTEGGTDWKKTFVNYFPKLELTKLKDRADNIKDELKKCDAKLNTYIYQYLEKDITWSQKALDLGIDKSINDWIRIARVSQEIDNKKTWNDTWHDYCLSLESQIEQREEVVETGKTVHSKLIPEACAIAFADNDESFFTGANFGLKELFGEGGAFHE